MLVEPAHFAEVGPVHPSLFFILCRARAFFALLMTAIAGGHATAKGCKSSCRDPTLLSVTKLFFGEVPVSAVGLCSRLECSCLLL